MKYPKPSFMDKNVPCEECGAKRFASCVRIAKGRDFNGNIRGVSPTRKDICHPIRRRLARKVYG